MLNHRKYSVFKYFCDKSHLEKFLHNGEVFFNTLSYFLSCEDLARIDITEDANVYMPSNGLEITISANNQKLKGHRGLISRVRRPDRVFVFCTSLELSKTLFQKFGADGCIEISDVQEFSNRISRHLRKSAHNIKNRKILSDNVEYYDFDEEPGVRYVCPDKIIMSKNKRFSDEKEHRIAFAKDADAFAVNNVNHTLTDTLEINAAPGVPKKLILGGLSDIAKVVM
jgi:hypothetical protein